ncbi:MFS transporter [Clostridium sporogenes]|uniref:MFS transporter n=1 Tax=Clostridium botulinum TaxID=1491 RepID=A0A6M0T4J7_CLOBO|nr:MFS transporter [Clostridium sporogenes]NFA61870.1 MFS transporter [Clostridium botulinum]NFI75455.1 MFS transporter [Clostridium sporogenes]NFL72986.1 MFS transporter [Clostridium sporogenes]NFM25558.1 MFS transporter [Clostridium sporogenes]NFP63583.1 MFS transporter [Clostridium sporogenes]
MILIAVCDSTRGIFIPIFKNQFNVNNTKIGLMLTISTLGYTLFTYLGGILCEKKGQKKVYSIGILIISICFLLLNFVPNYIILVILMFLINGGQAFLAISSNTIIPIIFISFQAIIMNLTHFNYGMGLALSQRIFGILLYRGITWRRIYLCLSIITFIVYLLSFFINIPVINKSKDDNKIRSKEIFKDKLLYFYIFGLGFYVFSEIATGNWFVNLMENGYKYNKNQSSYYIFLFSALLALGRLLGGFLVEKFSYIKSVCVSLTMALIMYTLGITLGQKGLILISLSGIFFSIIYPTVVLTISKAYSTNSSYVTGIVVTLSSFVNMIINFFMGCLNDSIGIYASYYLIPISLFISLMFMFLIHKNIKKLA